MRLRLKSKETRELLTICKRSQKNNLICFSTISIIPPLGELTKTITLTLMLIGQEEGWIKIEVALRGVVTDFQRERSLQCVALDREHSTV